MVVVSRRPQWLWAVRHELHHAIGPPLGPAERIMGEKVSVHVEL
jgi:hypothetical protein